MASSGKIDELKKKFDENPRRYFAPLANEYRKLGDLEQAIAICREHLPRQPGHMSGHIVFGQALFDAHEMDEAKTVFETALTLDPENLIALRHLGDIALQAGDADAARGWYFRVLEADPRNEEIAALLNAAPAGSPPAPPADAPVHGSGSEEASKWAPPPIQEEPQAATATAPGADRPQADESPGPAWPSGVDDTPTLIMETYTPAASAETPAPGSPAESESLELEDDLAFDVPPSPAGDASGGTRRSAFGVELDRIDDSGLSAPAVPEFAPTPPAFPEFSLPADDAESSAASSVKPADPFATETMAELYLSQGHYADALRVFRELETQRPGDSTLEAKIATVEALLAPTPVLPAAAVPEVPDEIPRPASPEPPQFAPEVESGHAADTGDSLAQGPTIRQFLGSLAMRTPYAGNIAQPSIEIPAAAAVPTPPERSPDASARDDVPALDFDVAMEEIAYEEVSAVTEEMVPYVQPSDETLQSADADATTAAPPGGSIDALFDGAEIAPADSSAASMLASAFGSHDDAPASESAPISGSPARRASQELSLDTVFRDDAAQTPAPAASFSFDQFFAAPTPAAGSPVIHPTPGPSGPATEDDIEQFNSWLQGLKKR
jgi:tetratricopeptide (TPR) repeat protein